MDAKPYFPARSISPKDVKKCTIVIKITLYNMEGFPAAADINYTVVNFRAFKELPSKRANITLIIGFIFMYLCYIDLIKHPHNAYAVRL